MDFKAFKELQFKIVFFWKHLTESRLLKGVYLQKQQKSGFKDNNQFIDGGIVNVVNEMT